MAWEVRVSAAPDFHLTIFVEIKTSEKSTGLTNFSFTNRYISKKSPTPPYQPNKPAATDGKFLKGFGGTFSKKFPQGISRGYYTTTAPRVQADSAKKDRFFADKFSDILDRNTKYCYNDIIKFVRKIRIKEFAR